METPSTTDVSSDDGITDKDTETTVEKNKDDHDDDDDDDEIRSNASTEIFEELELSKISKVANNSTSQQKSQDTDKNPVEKSTPIKPKKRTLYNPKTVSISGA